MGRRARRASATASPRQFFCLFARDCSGSGSRCSPPSRAVIMSSVEKEQKGGARLIEDGGLSSAPVLRASRLAVSCCRACTRFACCSPWPAAHLP
eukprot:4426035-Heterocapsa_arctica.AAC.1